MDASGEKRRDRPKTRQKIINAVGEILCEKGFEGLGLNAVARCAGANKVLIYRYFGGLPELLKAYGEENDFWWTADELFGAGQPEPERDTLGGWLGLGHRRHMEALARRPVTLEILAWELVEQNSLTAQLERVREKRNVELITRIGARFGNAPVPLLREALVLFGAATNYLVVRRRQIPIFNGMDITNDDTSARLSLAIEAMVDGLVARRDGR